MAQVPEIIPDKRTVVDTSSDDEVLAKLGYTQGTYLATAQ
jgi:hypothetical protein